jgi:hypothetical protein
MSTPRARNQSSSPPPPSAPISLLHITDEYVSCIDKQSKSFGNVHNLLQKFVDSTFLSASADSESKLTDILTKYWAYLVQPLVCDLSSAVYKHHSGRSLLKPGVCKQVFRMFFEIQSFKQQCFSFSENKGSAVGPEFMTKVSEFLHVDNFLKAAVTSCSFELFHSEAEDIKDRPFSDAQIDSDFIAFCSSVGQSLPELAKFVRSWISDAMLVSDPPLYQTCSTCSAILTWLQVSSAGAVSSLLSFALASQGYVTTNESDTLASMVMAVKNSLHNFDPKTLSRLRLQYDEIAEDFSIFTEFHPCDDVSRSTITLAHLFVLLFKSNPSSHKSISLEVQICCYCKVMHVKDPEKMWIVCEALMLAFCVCESLSIDENVLTAFCPYLKSQFVTRTSDPTTLSKTFESKHPYDNSEDYDIDISFPGAKSIEIVFDEKCRTEGGCDYVRFRVDDKVVGSDKYTGCGDGVHWAGVKGVPKLVVPGSKVTGHFHSDGSRNDWGYKFTAVASLPPAKPSAMINDVLQACIACMSESQYLASIVSGSCDSSARIRMFTSAISDATHASSYHTSVASMISKFLQNDPAQLSLFQIVRDLCFSVQEKGTINEAILCLILETLCQQHGDELRQLNSSNFFEDLFTDLEVGSCFCTGKCRNSVCDEEVLSLCQHSHGMLICAAMLFRFYTGQSISLSDISAYANSKLQSQSTKQPEPFDSLATVRQLRFKVRRSSGIVETNWRIKQGAIARYGRIECENGEYTRGCSIASLKELNAEEFKDVVIEPDVLDQIRGKTFQVKRSSGVVDSGWLLTEGAVVREGGLVEVMKGDITRTSPIQELLDLNPELMSLSYEIGSLERVPPQRDGHTVQFFTSMCKNVATCCAWLKILTRFSAAWSKSVVKSNTFESKHPYDNSEDYDIDISFPGAKSIEIVFDEKCRTEGGCDYVRFRVDDKVVGSDKYTGRGDGVHWAGVKGVPKLVVPGSKVTGHFHSDGSENDWGYKFTATARITEGQDDPHSKLLHDGLLQCFLNMVICDGMFKSELLNDGLSKDVTADVVSLLVSSWRNPLVSSAFANMLDGWLSRSAPPEAISYFSASMCRLLLSSHVAVESLQFSVGDHVAIMSECEKGSIVWHRNRQCSDLISAKSFPDQHTLVSATVALAAPVIDEVKGALIRVGERWYTRCSVLKIEYHYLVTEKMLSMICADNHFSKDSPIHILFESIMRKISEQTGSNDSLVFETLLWASSLVSSQKIPSSYRPQAELELWKGQSDDADLSAFASKNVISFKRFSTVRGPAFHRHKVSCCYEIEILEAGSCPQYGFCTASFNRHDGSCDRGCGDDCDSWAWDGVRHQFWDGTLPGNSEFLTDLSEISWRNGDILTFVCDFECNKTYISKNGIGMHERAFSPDINILFPAITGQIGKINVNFGSRPFVHSKSSFGTRNIFLSNFEKECAAQPPFLVSLRVILGNLLSKQIVQNGQLNIPQVFLSDAGTIKYLCSSLWFNGNESLLEATADFFTKHFCAPSQSTLLVCQALLSCLVEGIETPLIAFVKTGELHATADIAYLDDSNRISAVHRMLWSVVETTFGTFLRESLKDYDQGFLNVFLHSVEKTISQMNAAFASASALSDVFSSYQAQLFAKVCFNDSFYSSDSQQKSSIEAICKCLGPQISNSGVMHVFRHELHQMQENMRYRLASQCSLMYLMKLAEAPSRHFEAFEADQPSKTKSKPSKGEETKFSVGHRVRRGPDWKWDNQDSNGPGTVVDDLDSDGWIAVKWDNGSRNKYRTDCFLDIIRDARACRSYSSLYDRYRYSKKAGGMDLMIDADETKSESPRPNMGCRCRSGHELESFVYKTNSHRCDLCRASISSGQRGLRCQSCDYDLCPHCSRRLSGDDDHDNADLPFSCAARRPDATGPHLCEFCRGQYNKCFGSYGHRSGTSKMWRSGATPDLGEFPESPNERWCCQLCEDASNDESAVAANAAAETKSKAEAVPNSSFSGQDHSEMESAVVVCNFFERLSGVFISSIFPDFNLHSIQLSIMSLADMLELEGPTGQLKFEFWLKVFRVLTLRFDALFKKREKPKTAKTQDSGLKQGSKVILAEGYASMEDAKDGPLQPGDVGEIAAMDRSSKPLHVKAMSGAKVGESWWYVVDAVVAEPTTTLVAPASFSDIEKDFNLVSILLSANRSILTKCLSTSIFDETNAASRVLRIQDTILNTFLDDQVDFLIQLALQLSRSSSSYSLHNFFTDLSVALLEEYRDVPNFSFHSSRRIIDTVSESMLNCPDQHPLLRVKSQKSQKESSKQWGCNICKVPFPAGSEGIMLCKVCKPSYYVCVKCQITLRSSHRKCFAQIMGEIFQGIMNFEPIFLIKNAETLFAESFDSFVQASTLPCGEVQLSDSHKLCNHHSQLQYLAICSMLVCQPNATSSTAPIATGNSAESSYFLPPFNNFLALTSLPSILEERINSVAFKSNTSNLQSKIACVISCIRHLLRLSNVTFREIVKSNTFESKHPYDNSEDYDIDISFPGAKSIEIVFDEKCRTEGGCDYVRFRVDDKVVGSDKYTGRGDGVHWAGVKGVPKLVVPGSKVTGHFHSDGSENDWGYKFTATARITEGQDDPHSKLLHDGLLQCFLNMVICDGMFKSELLNDGLSKDVTADVVSLLVSSWRNPLVSSAFANMLDGWLSRSAPPEAISYFSASMCRLLLSSHVAVESLQFSVGDHVAIMSECEKGSIVWHRNRQCSDLISAKSFPDQHTLVSATVALAAPVIDEVKGALIRVGERWYTRCSVLKIQEISLFHFLIGLGCDIFESRVNKSDLQSKSSVETKQSQTNASLLSKFKSAAFAVKLAAKVNIFSRHSFFERFIHLTHYLVKSLSVIGYGSSLECLFPHLLDWIKDVTRSSSQSVFLEHYPKPFSDVKVGDKVAIGPDWMWPSPPSDTGTVVDIRSDGWIQVKWPKSSELFTALYRFGFHNSFDVIPCSLKPLNSPNVFEGRMRLLLHIALSNLCVSYGQFSIPASIIENEDSARMLMHNLWFNCNEMLHQAASTDLEKYFSSGSSSKSLCQFIVQSFALACNLGSSLKSDAFVHVDKTFCVEFKGYLYRALAEGWDPHGPHQVEDDDSIKDQSETFLSLPAGFMIASNEADCIEVVGSYGWSTHCMVLSDGSSVGTKSYSGNTGRIDCQDELETKGDKFRPRNGCRGILIRKPLLNLLTKAGTGSSEAAEVPLVLSVHLTLSKILSSDLFSNMTPFVDSTKTIASFHSMMDGLAQLLFEKYLEPAKVSHPTVHHIVAAAKQSSSELHSVFGGISGLSDLISVLEGVILAKACLSTDLFCDDTDVTDSASVSSPRMVSFSLQIYHVPQPTKLRTDRQHIFDKIEPLLGDPKLLAVLREGLHLQEVNSRLRFVSSGVRFFLEEAHSSVGSTITVLESSETKFILTLVLICLDFGEDSSGEKLLTMLEAEMSSMKPQVSMTDIWVSTFRSIHYLLRNGKDYMNCLSRLRLLIANRLVSLLFDNSGLFLNPVLPENLQEYMEIAMSIALQDANHSNKILFNISFAASTGNAQSIATIINAFRRQRQQQTDQDASFAYFLQICSGSCALVFQNDFQKFVKANNFVDPCLFLAGIHELCECAVGKVLSLLQPIMSVPPTQEPEETLSSAKFADEHGGIDNSIRLKLKHHLVFVLASILNNSSRQLLRTHICSQIRNMLQSTSNSCAVLHASQSSNDLPTNLVPFFQSIPHMDLAISSLSDDGSFFEDVSCATFHWSVIPHSDVVGGTADSSLNKNGLNQDVIEFGSQKSPNLHMQSAIGSVSLESAHGDWEWEISFYSFDRRLHVCSVGVVAGIFEKGVVNTKDIFFIGISSRHGYLRNGKIVKAATFGPGDHIRLCYKSSVRSLQILVNGIAGCTFDSISSSQNEAVFPVARTNRPSCQVVMLKCFSFMSATQRNQYNRVFPAVEHAVSSFTQTLSIANIVALAASTEQYVKFYDIGAQQLLKSSNFDCVLTSSIKRGFTFSNSNMVVSFPSGPVVCFSDVLCDPSIPFRFVYLCFKATGSNDSWSIGVVPESKVRDQEFLWERSEAVGCYNSGSNCSLQRVRLPKNEPIFMCIDTIDAVWFVYVGGREVCRQRIPQSQFPCRLGMSGHSNCQFELLPDEPLPDSFSYQTSAAVTETNQSGISSVLFTECSAQSLVVRMINKCCTGSVLERLSSLAKTDAFDVYYSIVEPLLALDIPARDTCIGFILSVISMYHPSCLSGVLFVKHFASRLFEGCDGLSLQAASVSNRLCAVASSGAFSTSRKALDMLSKIVQPVMERSTKHPGIFKCCVPLWCINSLAPMRASSLRIRFGSSIGQHSGIMLDAGWANVAFGGENFRVSISCACVLSFIMDSPGHGDAFEISFLQQQTVLPSSIIRSACEHLEAFGLIEFLQDGKAVRLQPALKSKDTLLNVKRVSNAKHSPFTPQYVQLVSHLLECFKSKGCVDEVLFSHDALSQLDVDAASVGYFLCDMERREIIRRSRGYLHPTFDQSSDRTPIADPVELSLLQSALHDFHSFESLPKTSWLSSIVLFVPDHSITSPLPWTCSITSGFTISSMEEFCHKVAPLLVDICKRSGKDSLYISQVFLKNQGCIATTMLEVLSNRIPDAVSDSCLVACKSKQGFCVVCLDDDATLFSPCEGSIPDCWKCAICWAEEVKTVRKPLFIGILTLTSLTSAQVTGDTSSVDESRITYSDFQQCKACKGPITEKFLDVVLASNPQILNTFKVSPHFSCDTAHAYRLLGVYSQLLLLSAVFGWQSALSLLLRRSSCCSS